MTSDEPVVTISVVQLKRVLGCVDLTQASDAALQTYLDLVELIRHTDTPPSKWIPGDDDWRVTKRGTEWTGPS